MASLDSITPARAAPQDTPVLVLHLYQSAILNRAAITALGYTKNTPDPLGWQIVRDHASNPTGVLLATPAPFILYGVLGRLAVLEPDQQVSFTRHASYGETIDSRLAIFDVFAAGGCSQRHPAVLRPCRDGEPAVARAHRCSRRPHLRPDPHRYGR